MPYSRRAAYGPVCVHTHCADPAVDHAAAPGGDCCAKFHPEADPHACCDTQVRLAHTDVYTQAAGQPALHPVHMAMLPPQVWALVSDIQAVGLATRMQPGAVAPPPPTASVQQRYAIWRL
jgi:hypothetical protein